MGCNLDGLPAGTSIDSAEIAEWMSYRRPAMSEITSQRKEEDAVEMVSGLVGDKTDGGSLTMLIRNKDVVSAHYDEIKYLPRPGHADLTLFQKYGEYRNYSGGGFLSGRMTAPIVAAGAICNKILENSGISIRAWASSIGDVSSDAVPENPRTAYKTKTRMVDPGSDKRAGELLRDLIAKGDSVGARISVLVDNLPAGVGEPFFDSIESSLAKGIFSIPAVKGIEFGAGFRFTSMKGSEAVDSIYFDGSIRTRKNNNGGILGGISNGMPVQFNVAMKPTSSIRTPLETVDLRTMKPGTLQVKGRHDPCVGIRAVAVVHCLTAFIFLDLLMQSGKTFHNPRN